MVPGGGVTGAGRPGPSLVDVGVVTWNTAELTTEALRRLAESDQGVPLRLLVHDNASVDGTPDMVRRAVPDAEVEVSDANLGFAAGMNRLIARSRAPWFLALNSDAWPEPGAIGALLDTAMASAKVAAVAPRLERPDGTLEHSTHPFPSLRVALVDAAGRRWLPRARRERWLLEGSWSHDRRRSVDWAVGAALLLSRAAIEDIGGFDERYFMYVEDLDWCWRASRHGWDVVFEPGAVVRHVGNVSGRRRFGAGRVALETANLYDFYRRTHGRWATSTYRAANLVAARRQQAAARRRGDGGAEQYWRTVARAHLGREVLPPSPQGTTPLAPARSADA